MTLLSVAQMNSQNDIEANFLVIESLIQQSKANGAELIVFPENFVCFAAGKQRETAAQFEDIQKRLENLAHQYQIWIVAGTLPCPFRPDGLLLRMVVFVQSVFALALNVLKHVMTKFICLTYKLAMLWVATKNRSFLNLVQMSLWQKHLLVILA